MSNLKDCIKRALDQGEITHDQAQALYDKYDQLARQILSPAAIRKQMADELEAEALDKKRRTLLAEKTRIDREGDVLGYRDRKGQFSPWGIIYLVSHHGEVKFQDVDHKQRALLGHANDEMEQVLHEFRKGAVLGDLRRRTSNVAARLDNVVRELFGQGTGDAKAKELAAAWTKVAEDLRQRFNAAGGAIGKLKEWGLPQMHAQEALLAAGKDEWIGFIEPKLDAAKMKNPLTGITMTAAELRQSLMHVYDTIVSDGWNTREPSGQAFGAGALFRRHADHRFLHFKDADAWLEYQRAFGEGDPFAAMMGHLSTMTRDIAAMEVLSPNPKAMLTHLLGVVEKANPNHPDLPKVKKRLDDMWAHVSGTANMPVGTRLANTAAGARNLISAASLGSATLSAITDLGFQAAARKFAGLPVLPMFNDFLRQFTTANTREAVRAGLIMDSALHAMHQQARYIGSISGRTWSGYINDRVLTYSGLQAWTQAGKHSFGLAMQAELADRIAKPLEQLPGALRRLLERHGFGEPADLGPNSAGMTRWDVIRGAQLYEPRPGATFLRPREIKALAGNDLADRYVSMILRETRYAVPESTIAARAGMMSQNQPGTFVGELIRSAGQFKSFGVAVVMLHGGRIMREVSGGSKARGALYAGGLLITTTLLGAVAMQLKEIAGGRDPRKMDLSKEGRKFWGAAMLQGGGMGIYGDFLFADVNRFGGSLAGTVGGPMIDRLDNIRRLIVGNPLELFDGKKKTNTGRELAQFVKQNTPGSSLWFLRLAYERVLMDQLQFLLDKDAHTAFNKRMQMRKKDFGNEFWWKPGRTEPSRGPDLSKMFGG